MVIKTGQNFTAKIRRNKVEGKILVELDRDKPYIFLCQDHEDGFPSPSGNRLGYAYTYVLNPYYTNDIRKTMEIYDIKNLLIEGKPLTNDFILKVKKNKPKKIVW